MKKSILSLFIVTASLLVIVFLQMEERRVGYDVLKMGRKFREIQENKKWLEIQLAKSLKLDKLQTMVHRKSTLRKIEMGQVIYLNDENPKLDFFPETSQATK